MQSIYINDCRQQSKSSSSSSFSRRAVMRNAFFLRVHGVVLYYIENIDMAIQYNKPEKKSIEDVCLGEEKKSRDAKKSLV